MDAPLMMSLTDAGNVYDTDRIMFLRACLTPPTSNCRWRSRQRLLPVEC